jgi:hypothetical protein
MRCPECHKKIGLFKVKNRFNCPHCGVALKANANLLSILGPIAYPFWIYFSILLCSSEGGCLILANLSFFVLIIGLFIVIGNITLKRRPEKL